MPAQRVRGAEFVLAGVAVVATVFLTGMLVEHAWFAESTGRTRAWWYAGCGAVAAGIVMLLAFDTLYRRPESEADRRLERQVQQQLQRLAEVLWISGERFRALVEKCSDGIALLSAEGNIRYVAPSIRRILGHPGISLVGTSVFDLIHPEDVERLRQQAEECLARPGEDLTAVFRCRHADGSWGHLEAILNNRLDEPAVAGIVVNFRDVSLRIEAEQQLRRREREFADFVQNAPVAINWAGPDGQILGANRAELELLGYPEEEYVGRNLADFHADPAIAREFLRRLQANETLCLFEAPLRARDGSLRHVLISSNVLWQDGRFVHTRCFTQDITARKRAEEALRQSEERYRLIAEASSDAIVTIDEGSVIRFVNRAAEKIFGYAVEELVGRPLTLLMPDRLRPRHRDALQRFCATGQKHIPWQGVEMPGLHADGHEIPLEISFGESMQDDGTHVFVGMLRDISTRKQAEQELARLAAIVQFSEDAILSAGLDGCILSWNPAAERLYGYAAEEIVGRNLALLVPTDRLDEASDAFDRLARGEAVEPFETVRLHRSGRPIDVSLRLSPIPDATGRMTGVSLIARDITTRKRLERELQEAQKLEAAGRLAGGVAHEFNNLLTALLGYSDLALGQARPDEPAYRHLEEIKKAAERAAVLVRQLLAFSRTQPIVPRPLDLNRLVADLEKTVRRLLNGQVEVCLELPAEPALVRADAGQLERALLNLALNARDAMPQGGRLRLAVSQVELNRSYARVHPDVHPGPYVLLEVSDTGVGMSEEVQAHLFEPFFTTKESPASGLGLATVWGIVRQAGGHIRVHSQPGQGTSFRLYFPRLGEAEATDETLDEQSHGRETVLLVEDEPAVRALLGTILERHGYRTLEARDPQEAILIGEQHRGPIHLLLTDMVMPSMSGRELALRLLQRRPDLKVLFISGHVGLADEDFAGMPWTETAFLPKPFAPETLVGKIRTVLTAEAVGQAVRR